MRCEQCQLTESKHICWGCQYSTAAQHGGRDHTPVPHGARQIVLVSRWAPHIMFRMLTRANIFSRRGSLSLLVHKFQTVLIGFQPPHSSTMKTPRLRLPSWVYYFQLTPFLRIIVSFYLLHYTLIITKNVWDYLRFSSTARKCPRQLAYNWNKWQWCWKSLVSPFLFPF